MTGKLFGGTLAVIALALLGVPAQAQQEQAEPTQFGDVEVTVAVADGKPLKKATVYAKTGRISIEAAGTPAVITKIPAGKTAVTVDAEVSQGANKGTKRYMGVAEAVVVEGQPQKVKVSVEPVPVIDTFCLTCHPNPRDPKVKVKPGQIVRDVHSSGKAYPEKGYDKYVEMNKLHNAKVEALDKEGKEHGLMPMPTEVRVVKIGGKDVKRVFYTCETCHSLHQSTPWPRFTRAPFKDRSDLCSGCHS
jgi:predicted CXXCH cytochrome family protein